MPVLADQVFIEVDITARIFDPSKETTRYWGR